MARNKIIGLALTGVLTLLSTLLSTGWSITEYKIDNSIKAETIRTESKQVVIHGNVSITNNYSTK